MNRRLTSGQRSFSLFLSLIGAFALLVGLGILEPKLTLRQATAQPAVSTDDRHFQQWWWFYSQRSYPFDRIPPRARQQAMEQLAEARRSGLMPGAAISGTRWVSIGPAPIQNGLIAGSGPTSGRVSTIATHPTDPNIVYIGAAQGGVWKSINAGASWTPLTDQQCSLAMGSLAIDPVNPNIIYAGTDEQHFSQDSYYGCGVLRSTDGGITWLQLGASVFVTICCGGAMISRIIIDPLTAGSATNTTIYVASDFGLYRSTNSGASFTRVLGAPEGYCCIPVTDLVIDPGNPKILYAAAVGVVETTRGSIFKSTDGGTTWTQVNNGLPPAGTDWGFRINLAIAPSSPDILYAALQMSTGVRLFKTTNGGANWTELIPSGTTPSCGSQCGYDMVLAVDPTNLNVVYFGGLGLYKSTDGGFTWSDITNGVDFQGIHVDQHALAFDSPGRLYVGNDGGVWRIADDGAHWNNLNTNLAITQFYPGITLHPTNPSIILGGTQDNGTLKYSGSLAWQTVRGGDGGFTAIDFINPNTLYGEFQWPLGPWRCDDGGAPFCGSSKTTGINLSDNAVFIPPMVMDPSNSNVLIFGAGTKVYRTTDRAENWSAISPAFGVSLNGQMSTLAFAPTSLATIYGGSDGGVVVVTTNAGANWEVRVNGLGYGAITDLAVDPTNPQIAYVTTSGFDVADPIPGHIFRTTNGGVNWQNVSANLPDIPVNAVVIDPATFPRALYIGTDLGVFRSLNDGISWEVFNEGLPNVAVFDLALNLQTGLLVAATHGRGMFAIGNTEAFRTYGLGGDGRIYRWDGFGFGWTQITNAGGRDHFHFVSENEIYVLGGNGRIYKWNGSSFEGPLTDSALGNYFVID